jgi:hypothetical protein
VKLVTPCEGGSCISLDRRPGGGLVLTNSRESGSTPVTADEVRQFAAAVQSGYFDELLDQPTREEIADVVERILAEELLEVAAFNSAM